MDFNQFKEEIFALAKEKGFDDYEIFYQTNKSLSLNSYEGKIDEFKNTRSGGVSFRGILNGKSSMTFSEVIDENTAKYLVDNTFEAVQFIEDEDEVLLHDGSGEYKEDLNMYFSEIDEIKMQEKIDYVLNLEAKAKEKGDIDKVLGAYYSDSNVYIKIANSKGLDLEEEQNYIYSYIGLSKADEVDTQVEYEDCIAYNKDELYNNTMIEDAKKELFKKLNSKSIKTGNYPCVFRRDAMSELLSAFCDAFNAKACQKGFSPYADKVGEMIASDIITIVDDPHIERGLSTSKFDGEGVATFKKTIVEKGVLKTHLHNLSTAKKAGVTNTANASRGGFKSDIGISPTNFFIENGTLSFEELVKEMGEGVIITDMAGLHSGLNVVSGNFSLSAKGFYYKNGEYKPVHQIVITDNFYDMIKRIQNIANDLDLMKSSIASPSIRIDSISVAGKEENEN